MDTSELNLADNDAHISHRNDDICRVLMEYFIC